MDHFIYPCSYLDAFCWATNSRIRKQAFKERSCFFKNRQAALIFFIFIFSTENNLYSLSGFTLTKEFMSMLPANQQCCKVGFSFAITWHSSYLAPLLSSTSDPFHESDSANEITARFTCPVFSNFSLHHRSWLFQIPLRRVNWFVLD